ncbi:transcription termination/antitermination NusG family protein [Scytonema sp. NUACC26]|uniref:transcription termination/antitermination NusG family protein n=1 Tax=Scytonema sp. NUACC26 TaxID=3140176 RepID=UPI0034DC3A29
MSYAKLKYRLFGATYQELVALCHEYNVSVQTKAGFNKLHVVLQEELFAVMSSQNVVEKIKNQIPVIRRNWYALFVRYGKEQDVIKTIVEQLKLNAVPEFKRNVDNGLIRENFKLDSIILDIAYAHEFDLTGNTTVENYKSYLFVEVDNIYDNNIFHNIVEPFFKNIIDVIGFVGLQEDRRIKTENGWQTVRLKQQFSKQGRSVLKYYADKVTTPVKVSYDEYERLERANASVSIYEQHHFSIGEYAWLCIKTKNGIQKRKVQVTKVLDHDHLQVMSKDKFKFPVSILDLRSI